MEAIVGYVVGTKNGTLRVSTLNDDYYVSGYYMHLKAGTPVTVLSDGMNKLVVESKEYVSWFNSEIEPRDEEIEMLTDPSQVPEFQSEEEEIEFWMTHGLSEEFLAKTEQPPDDELPAKRGR
jgi:hypothetical protein